jgi:hypothetical protein
MTDTTVRANAQTLPEATNSDATVADLDAEIHVLADAFESAWAAERALLKVAGFADVTDEELEAANDLTHAIVEKLIARPSTSMLTIKLKARAYLWGEGCQNFEDLSPAKCTVSDPVLVSLFRDLLTDGAIGASPALSAQEEAV